MGAFKVTVKIFVTKFQILFQTKKNPEEKCQCFHNIKQPPFSEGSCDTEYYGDPKRTW